MATCDDLPNVWINLESDTNLCERCAGLLDASALLEIVNPPPIQPNVPTPRSSPRVIPIWLRVLAAIESRLPLLRFLREMNDWRRAGFAVVSVAELSRRWRTCRTCKHWRGVGCAKCGCAGVKLALATSRCPLKKPKWVETVTKPQRTR